MGDLPDESNVHSALTTTLSKQQVAELYRPFATAIRKCGWDEYEVRFPWAELIIEADSPILMHGVVAEVRSNLDRLLSPLREAGIRFHGECYTEAGELLTEFRSGDA